MFDICGGTRLFRKAGERVHLCYSHFMAVILIRFGTHIHGECVLYYVVFGILYPLRREWLDVSLFIYLFICWISRVGVFLLCYHSIAPCTSKGDISVSAICH